VAADEGKAFRLYERAAASGRPQSLHNLGAAYMAGTGVEHDECKAAEYFRQAAEAGNLASKWNLAHMYEQGRGVPQDLERALALLHEIAQEGYEEDVADSVEQIRRRLDAGELGDTTQMARILGQDSQGGEGGAEGARAEGGRRVGVEWKEGEESLKRVEWNTQDTRTGAVRIAREVGTPVDPRTAVVVELRQEGVAAQRVGRARRRSKDKPAGEAEKPRLDVAIDPTSMRDPSRLPGILRELADLGTTRQDEVLKWLERKSVEEGFRIQYVRAEAVAPEGDTDERQEKSEIDGERAADGGADDESVDVLRKEEIQEALDVADGVRRST
jgi:hypothetical protein